VDVDPDTVGSVYRWPSSIQVRLLYNSGSSRFKHSQSKFLEYFYEPVRKFSNKSSQTFLVSQGSGSGFSWIHILLALLVPDPDLFNVKALGPDPDPYVEYTDQKTD